MRINIEKFAMVQDMDHKGKMQLQIEETLNTTEVYMLHTGMEIQAKIWEDFNDWAKVANYKQIVKDGKFIDNQNYIEYCAVLKKVGDKTIKGFFMNRENTISLIDRLIRLMEKRNISTQKINSYFS